MVGHNLSFITFKKYNHGYRCGSNIIVTSNHNISKVFYIYCGKTQSAFSLAEKTFPTLYYISYTHLGEHFITGMY